MIGLRRGNGQIGYLSEGYSLPEFFALIRGDSAQRRLLDYSPLIEALHGLIGQMRNDDIHVDYNDLYTYWAESKSYSAEAVKISRAGDTCKQANSLLSKVRFKFQGVQVWKLGQMNSFNRLEFVRSLKGYCNTYINALLFYVYAKASIEVASFKNDTVLQRYSNELKDFIWDVYEAVRGPDSDDLIRYMVFRRPDDAPDFLAIESVDLSPSQLKLEALERSRPQSTVWNESMCRHEYVHVVSYVNYHDDHVSSLMLLRDLLFKIGSVSQLIEDLSKGGVEWDSTEQAVTAVSNEIRKIENSGPRARRGH